MTDHSWRPAREADTPGAADHDQGDTSKPIDLAAIRARADAATPGPWDPGIVYGTVIRRQGGTPVASTRGQADAELIAHARTDIPGLLGRIAELEAHPPMLVDPGAEQRGYERAIKRIRARNALFAATAGATDCGCAELPRAPADADGRPAPGSGRRGAVARRGRRMTAAQLCAALLAGIAAVTAYDAWRYRRHRTR